MKQTSCITLAPAAFAAAEIADIEVPAAADAAAGQPAGSTVAETDRSYGASAETEAAAEIAAAVDTEAAAAAETGAAADTAVDTAGFAEPLADAGYQ